MARPQILSKTWKMLRQVGRGSARVLRVTALRHLSAPVAPLKIVRPPQKRETSAATIATPGVDKAGAFLAWQQRLRPQLADLDPGALNLALLEAEKKWLPLLPEKDFMDAWLDASKPVMTEMHLMAWVRAQKLGAQPDTDFVLQLAVAATDQVLRSCDSLTFNVMYAIYKWGGTLETMRPLLEAGEKAVLAQLRSQNARCLFTNAPEVFQQVGYIPSKEFVRFWVANLNPALRVINQEALPRILTATARMPTDDASLLFPLLNELTAKKTLFKKSDPKLLLSMLWHLGDLGFEPPVDWLKEASIDLLAKMQRASDRECWNMLVALGQFATPVREKESVALWFAQTRSMSKMLNNALIEVLAAMLRLGIILHATGEQWCRSWLQEAYRRIGRGGVAADCSVRDLLLACRDAAVSLMEPIYWSLDMPAAAKASCLMRRLRDLFSLSLYDACIIRMWLEQAKEVGRFRRYQVGRASEHLRDLGAEDAAQEWEQHNAM